MEEQNKVPKKYYIFGLLVVLALVGVTFIPSSMVYRLRLFDAVGLPEWMGEIVRIVILFATPAAVLATGLMRLFAVSDKDHARAMAQAAALEGLACVLEIVAALVNGRDIWALIGQAITLGGAIAAAFGALVLTLTENGYYKLLIAEHQRMLDFNQGFAKLFADAMKSDQARETMQQGVDIIIKSKTEQIAGRALGTVDQAGQGKSKGKQTQPSTMQGIEEKIRSLSGNGKGTEPKN